MPYQNFFFFPNLMLALINIYYYYSMALKLLKNLDRVTSFLLSLVLCDLPFCLHGLAISA
jgi:hypothetical protein